MSLNTCMRDSYKQSLNAVNKISNIPDLIDIMISVEDYFDRNDLYVFKNWMLGELVMGPVVKPYWICIAFKWDYKNMPDPAGIKRLLPQGTKVKFTKKYENVPQPIKNPGDYLPGTHKPKIKKEPIWVVEFKIPRRFIDNLDDVVLDLYQEKVSVDYANDAAIEQLTPDDIVKGTANV